MDVGSVLVGFGGGVAVAAVVAYVVTARSVAKVRAAERRAQGAERMAEIGAMTGGLAHEIKNPLSTIGLNAGLLLETIQELEIPDDERARLLNRMRGLKRETERLGDILRDFLEYAGQVHLERRDVELSEVLGELVDFFTPEAERQGVRIRCELGSGGVRASVDVRLVKQAILNLMINATQAMSGANAASAGGGRELILRLERGKELDGRGVACVHVIDTGPGIEPETLQRIFNPYFTTKPGGSGLGLPMSRRLIEAHGGSVRVHSEPGRGTDFTITLPLDVPMKSESA